MTKQELIDRAKLRARKSSSDDLDKDIEQLVEVAIEDLKRIGVHKRYLKENNIKNPLFIEAVLLYVDANFGHPENHSDLMESYNMILTKIKGGGYHRSANKTAD